MSESRCAAHCGGCHGVGRREFLTAVSLGSASLLGGTLPGVFGQTIRKVEPKGPASRYVPSIKACFVRRQGDYGLRWPGAVYDGEAALKKYTAEIRATAKQLNCKLDLREAPLYSLAEADAWLAEATQAQPDGLLAVLLDRQQHAWPTAAKVAECGIPSVIFSPVGAAFTTNTAPLAGKTGCFIASTDDFRQVQYGMKMLRAAAKLRKTRCIVIAGQKSLEREMPHLGIKLRYLPAKTFAEEYQKTPVGDEIHAMAADMMGRAKGMVGATKDDVLNGLRSYVVARTLLEREEADAITMDCLGALGPTKISLPCIAWSKMNDDGIPAACEADLGAVATHCMVQYLFDRPGFQQDPVPETARDAIIGAHCSCPTRLKGFDQPPESYDITHHHALRDATARTVWRPGQRVTCADVLPGSEKKPTQVIISAGTVLENVAVPPAGGCVISVMVRLDGVTDVLAYPGFHQLFFYGDFKKELVQFCRLMKLEAVVV